MTHRKQKPTDFIGILQHLLRNYEKRQTYNTTIEGEIILSNCF